MRTFSGIKFFRSETNIFEPRRTKITPAPIPREFTTLVDTPSAGQSPRSTTKMGFSFMIPFVNSFNAIRYSFNPFIYSEPSARASAIPANVMVAPEMASASL